VIEKVNTIIVLPFTIDLRNEPLIIAKIEEEARRVLRNMQISRSRGRETLSLPVIGDVIAKFDKIPATDRDTEFNIIFKYPYETGRVNIGEEDKELFYEARMLPSEDWDEYWDRIYIDENVKNRALNYCLLMHNIRKYGVSRMALSQHRILIFYGPPGTGKTTLTRGLANKMARELSALGAAPTLHVEINAHQLSSEWLGKSAKQVERAFKKVEEAAANGRPVVCLIDEVESLLTNRTMTLNEANPTDVFKAVNAMFQQIDRIAERPNVYIFATSNLPKAIDRAFFDRADALFFVDLPNVLMRYRILCDIFEELHRTIGINIHMPNQLSEVQAQEPLDILLKETDGLSGRHMRKLVLEAMTYDSQTARNPESLQIEQIIRAANDYKERVAQDQRHGGTYEYNYSKVEGENTHE